MRGSSSNVPTCSVADGHREAGNRAASNSADGGRAADIQADARAARPPEAGRGAAACVAAFPDRPMEACRDRLREGVRVRVGSRREASTQALRLVSMPVEMRASTPAVKPVVKLDDPGLADARKAHAPPSRGVSHSENP